MLIERRLLRLAVVTIIDIPYRVIPCCITLRKGADMLISLVLYTKCRIINVSKTQEEKRKN
jgi:hypothetical protein